MKFVKKSVQTVYYKSVEIIPPNILLKFTKIQLGL